MILQRLAEHYDRIAASGNVDRRLPPAGFSRQKISFCIVLEPDGKLNSFQSLLEQSGKRQIAKRMTVPGFIKSSGSGQNPCFLWDNAAYMLGYKLKDQKPRTTIKQFESFRDKHLSLQSQISHPYFDAVCAFLKSWSPSEALQYIATLSEITTNNGVLRIAGTQFFLHDLFSAPERLVETRRGQCLVTGLPGSLVRIHEPAIMGLPGGKSFGQKIAAFDDSAYCSYGSDQSYNSPVDIDVAFRYASALNYLLETEERRVTLGDTTVVFWADHANVLEDFLISMFGGASIDEGPIIQEDKDRLMEAELLLKQVRDGTAATEITPDDQPTKFFLLGLSPNASRVSVRLWVEADAAELKNRLGQHLRDVALADTRDDRLLTLRRIVAATGRAEHDTKGRLKGFDTKATSPQLAGDLARSVLTGSAYPQSLLATMLRRIHSDGEVAYARVAAIKACLARNSRLRGNPLEVSKMLDNKTNDAAYCCGRAFALLEMIQKDSVEGELNRTIKDSYFTSASTTPSLIFPRLCRLSQHHLAKLDTGPRIYREKHLGEVLSKLIVFPRLLSLEDQGKFVLGYFHQCQDLYTSKKDKEEGVTA